MWLRDSGAQVWPYVQLANEDKELKTMLAGVINRQFKLINVDPFANAFNDGPIPDGHWKTDLTDMNDEMHERKWEIDSLCYPLRLAYHYWKTTGDTSIFDAEWIKAIQNILTTFRDQQRRDGRGSYHFQRVTERALDTMTNDGWGNPVKPVGLIASAFRPSDDATTFQFLVPSNFFAVTSLRKAAEILNTVNKKPDLAKECTTLSNEVEAALKDGSLHVFDTSKFTVNGETVTTAPIDLTFYDYSTGTPVAVYQGDTEEAITDGYFSESTLRSAPYFSLRIDGIIEDADPVA